MNQRDRQEDRCDSFLFLLSAFESISDPTVPCCDSSTTLPRHELFSPTTVKVQRFSSGSTLSSRRWKKAQGHEREREREGDG